MGHVWLGFEPGQVERLLTSAGFDAVRVHALEPEAGVKGPALFVASGVVLGGRSLRSVDRAGLEDTGAAVPAMNRH